MNKKLIRYFLLLLCTLFTFSAYAEDMAQQVVDQIKATPIFSLVNQYYPKESAKFFGDVKHAIEIRKPPEYVRSLSQKFMFTIVMQSEKTAPDNAQMKKLVMKIDLYRRLYKIDPHYVVTFESNQADASKLTTEFQQQLAKDSMDLITMMIKSSGQHPVSPPSAKQGDKYLAAVKQKLNKKYGKATVNKALDNDGSIKDKIRADIIIDYYTLIKADKHGADILRYLSSQVG